MTENEIADQVQGDEDHVEQLQQEDTLVDRGVADVLDEGYIAPDHWSPAQGFGNTAAEMRQGETLEMRVTQEVPEATAPDDSPWNPDGENREVGRLRAGRLVDANHGAGGPDATSEAVAYSVGIDGGAASAEEAAMHIIEPDDDDDVE